MYPGVSERIKSMVMDQVTVVFLLLITSSIVEANPTMPRYVNIGLFVLIFVYEPFMTSFLGGTIGHFMVGIRVKRQSNDSRNIPLPMAVIRVIVKYIFGVFSFISMSMGNKDLAIHDYVSGSVVVYKKEKE
ncbi:MAG: RDD family protein [Fluviicola sp.]|nr:RDD family protein [Fluviicola sp.]